MGTEDPKQKEFIDRYIQQLVLPGTEQSILLQLGILPIKITCLLIIIFENYNSITHRYAIDDDEIDPQTVETSKYYSPNRKALLFLVVMVAVK